MEWQDVWVHQAGCNVDLPQKSLRSHERRELGSEDFDGDSPVMPEIVSECDHRHSTGAELTLYLITAGHRPSQSYHGRLRITHLSGFRWRDRGRKRRALDSLDQRDCLGSG